MVFLYISITDIY